MKNYYEKKKERDDYEGKHIDEAETLTKRLAEERKVVRDKKKTERIDKKEKQE